MAAGHATAGHMFIYICLSFLLPRVNEVAAVYEDDQGFPNDDNGVRLTREYHLRQGALRGVIVKPSRQYDLQAIEMFLGVPYAAAPVGSLRFMPPVSAPPWPGLKKATHFAPVCPQSIPPIKKDNPPSRGRQHYINRLKPFLSQESEDCLYLNIYVPFREQKPKKFPVLVFVHGDSFEWSSGNPYDGRVLASYGNIMVVTINFRLGILGFMKPSLTEHVYGNNGLLDQLAALQWIKDNIEDLNGDPHSVTLMGHSTGAACVNFLMLSPISNGLFHRAILMSGSALSDWAMTKDPTQYTLQVAQSLGCSPASKDMMSCLQNKPLSEIKKVQILARDFETPLGPVVAGSFIPNEPAKIMEAFPNLLSKYQLLTGVTELERYHDFGVIELEHGVLENQRDDFIKKYAKVVFEGGEDVALKEILKQYAPSKLDPQRWSVETNRDVILNLFSDARTLAPMIDFANYQSKANRQSYFYVFGHNSVSTDYAALNKSVHGEELPYILGIPLGGTNSHFHSEYTVKEKLLSEVMMRLWTNFVKLGTPNTQSLNEYYSLDQKHWSQYNVEWPEYNIIHQSYLKLDIPPFISSLYRANSTQFWREYLPNKLRRYMVDPLFEFTSAPAPTTSRPKSTHRNTDSVRKLWPPRVVDSAPRNNANAPTYGKLTPYSPNVHRPDTDNIYREIQSIKTPSRPLPPGLMEKAYLHTSTTPKPNTNSVNMNTPVKASGSTIALVISLGILFLAVNVGICAILYFKKRKLRFQERGFENSRPSRAEIGEVDAIGQKSAKDEKSALRTFKNGCSVIKSMSVSKIRGSSKSKSRKTKQEPCKTPKSDDSGGFRERFQLRRHLSTSTLDAHTKVRDWIANEVMHRCSPNVLQKSSSDLNTDKPINIAKPFTRSEELLPETKNSSKNTLKVKPDGHSKTLPSKSNLKSKTSDIATSTSALGSHSSIGSNKQSISSARHTNKSSDSLKSRGTESIKSKKVSVAIDATPAARTNSILKQEPIEVTKSFDCIKPKHSKEVNKIQRLKTEIQDYDIIEVSLECKDVTEKRKTFTNTVTLSLNRDKPLIVSHKHSSSDPVTDVNYDKLREKVDCGIQAVSILPPVIFRNDINVTSRDESAKAQPLTAAEALLTIQRRNFPKVLPDLPKSQKRLSLQPGAFQTFKSYIGSFESQSDRTRVPPQPPPRTTTLERRLAYKNSKPLSSFDASGMRKITETKTDIKNYENVDSFPLQTEPERKNSEHTTPNTDTVDSPIKTTQTAREYPKVIIASSDTPISTDPKIIISTSRSQINVPANAPRVRLPDDFHSNTSSVTSFSSFFSDDDIDIDEEVDFEDKLIQELVGGVESPTKLNEMLFDTKGPATIYEKKLEVVPVKLNPGYIVPKSKEDYVSISDLHLPDVSDLERTAQIKANFSLNKLQHRSESINQPLERAIKVKRRRSMKPSSILNKGLKSKRSGDKDKSDLEHSNSGSSNDTESSTGTVREVRKD